MSCQKSVNIKDQPGNTDTQDWLYDQVEEICRRINIWLRENPDRRITEINPGWFDFKNHFRFFVKDEPIK